MLTLNSEQKLPASVLVYQLVTSTLGAVLIFGFLYFFMSVNPDAAKYAWVLKVLPVFVVFGYLVDFVKWNVFRFTASSTDVSITSGFLFRQTKVVNFNDLQSIDAAFGPVLGVFGLRKIQGFTSSPQQLVISSTKEGGTSTQHIPDVSIILDAATANEFMKVAKEGRIQKVQQVQSVVPQVPGTPTI